jgi:hypothetical protein
MAGTAEGVRGKVGEVWRAKSEFAKCVLFVPWGWLPKVSGGR